LLLDLKKYLTNLDSIDATYYAAVNRKKGLSKVIILPLDHSGNIHLGLTELEFDELKTVIRNYLCSDKKDNMATCKIELNSLNWN
jgi:hypothetical protein